MAITYHPAKVADLTPMVNLDILSYDTPLDEEIFINCIHLRTCYVAWDNKRIVGYISFQNIESEQVILGLAVHPAYRRQGIATKLVDFVIGLPNSSKITMEVREKNLSGQLFLRAIGFNCFSVLKNYYEDESDEDCYVFTLYVGATV